MHAQRLTSRRPMGAHATRFDRFGGVGGGLIAHGHWVPTLDVASVAIAVRIEPGDTG
jgi:hypothetical protein